MIVQCISMLSQNSFQAVQRVRFVFFNTAQRDAGSNILRL